MKKLSKEDLPEDYYAENKNQLIVYFRILDMQINRINKKIKQNKDSFDDIDSLMKFYEKLNEIYNLGFKYSTMVSLCYDNLKFIKKLKDNSTVIDKKIWFL